MSFEKISRQEFRNYFQPTRILLGVTETAAASSVNVITLCFSMYSSYKPNIMSVAVQNEFLSNQLFKEADEFVLAVPGERMADIAMGCGVDSGKNVDKVKKYGIELIDSSIVSVPSIKQAIANIECKKINQFESGDHTIFTGEVLGFFVNINNNEKCLLSMGKDTTGYELLIKRGGHRIGVVK